MVDDQESVHVGKLLCSFRDLHNSATDIISQHQKQQVDVIIIKCLTTKSQHI